MIIENKDLKPLIEMTDEEIVAIVRGKAEGKVERYGRNGAGRIWLDTDDRHLCIDVAYRLIPKYTPITVDWSVLDDDIQWIAADENGGIFGYAVRPIKYDTYWFCVDYHRLAGVIKSLNRGDIPWDQSLIKRPEGV